MYSYVFLFVGIAGSVLLITFSGCGLHGQLEYHKPASAVDANQRQLRYNYVCLWNLRVSLQNVCHVSVAAYDAFQAAAL
jgi:hypothetical protein